MGALPKYRTGLRAPITTLFDVFSIDFAGPFIVTKNDYKYLLICVEHLTGWPLVTPTRTATADEVIRFVQNEIILPFGHPRINVSGNATCFTAGVLQDYMLKMGITWKTVLAYAPMSNGRAERMVGTIKRAIGKMVLKNVQAWDEVLPSVLYGYRRRALSSGLSPYQLLYGVKPRMPFEMNVDNFVSQSSTTGRSAEILALQNARANAIYKKRSPQVDPTRVRTFSVGDKVLVARGQALSSSIKWPSFTSKYYGPCQIVSAHHPRYTLVSRHNRYTRQGIHARRIIPYFSRI